MINFTDKTKPVRQGEELDSVKLERYIKSVVQGLSGDLVIEQFPSGHSNLTYLLRIGDTEMVLRRPPFGSKVKSAHDMGREFRILSAIHPLYSRGPQPIHFCEDDSVIGAKFYLMERLKGVIFRTKVYEGMSFPPELAEEVSRAIVKNLADIHAIDYQAAGLADMARVEGFLARQVNGWTERYYGSQTDDVPYVEEVTTWLKTHVPESPPATLIHNDYKYDNIVLDQNDLSHIVGVLDWEMSTIGDPLMDLGILIGYWLEEKDPPSAKMTSFGPTDAPGSLTRQQLADYYAELTGRDTSNMLYYVCFARFKLAVIAQQIYYRYAKGLTTDERFAILIAGVKLLVQSSKELIESGRI